MKAAPIALLALACALPIAASAQWMYLDKDGHKVFSDKAPPPDIAPERILKGPRNTLGSAAMAPAPQQSTAADGSSQNGASTPALKPVGRDKALEERKKQLAAADAEKKKKEDEHVAALRADNCARARQSKNSYDSGQRIFKVDSKGERTFVDDSERAAELKRLDQIIARDCAQ